MRRYRRADEKRGRITFVLAGLAAGAVNGLFGGGGGMLLVPSFRLGAGMDQKKAAATSVAVILPLSLVSAATYLLRGSLELSAAWPYLAGGLAGGVIGGIMYKKLSPKLVGRLLGAVIIVSGVKLALFP